MAPDPDTPSSDEPPLVFDREAALAKLDGVDEYLVLLIDAFLRSSEEDLERIRAGVAEGDLRVVQRAAHRLKGSSGYFQVHAYQARLLEFETAARAEDANAVAAQWPVVERAHLRLLELLREARGA